MDAAPALRGDLTMPTIRLGVRPQPFTLPSYSLTADLLSFLRCGLQYRYTRLGGLASSEPVQLWFGQFIHGVLEEAFRRYAAGPGPRTARRRAYTDAQINDMIRLVEGRLAAQGLRAWEAQGRQLGHDRARAAIKKLGPSLFPLIHRAEVRLTGARRLPRAPAGAPERYEVAGVVDVITHVALRDPAVRDNRLVRTILTALGGQPPERFEVIIDYKGTRRPAPSRDGSQGLAETYHWQVQTYAHLREQQEHSLPVAAGVILYLNELYPSAGDIQKLRREIRAGTADVVPDPGSAAERVLITSSSDATGDALPIEFRLARAIRTFPVSPSSIIAALGHFDEVVARIEACRAAERRSGTVIAAWEHNAEDNGTCAACDARTFCPTYTKEARPLLPGIG
jgi:hypothetical protein